MKNIIFTFLLIANCHNRILQNSNELNFSITIWDYNYSMAYTNFYYINNDSLVIKYISGVNNENDSFLLRRTLSNNERDLFFNLFTSVNFDSLKNEYINPLVEDGNQKKIIINWGNKTKTIEIANFYQKDIESLFNTVNQIVPKNLLVQYTK